jgi:DNA-directed RNA polymerase subunit RPC12/RpoP
MIIWTCIKCGKEIELIEGANPVRCSCKSFRFRKAKKQGKYISRKNL